MPNNSWGVVSGDAGSSFGGHGDRLLLDHRHGRRHEYKYLAADLFTDRAISELPMRDVQFTWTISKPGELSGKVAVPAFANIRDYFHATVPARTVLYVIRDGVPVWGGIIWKRTFSSDERVLNIEADTWDSYMYHRILDEDHAFLRDVGEWTEAEKRHEGVEQIECFRILWRHMSADRGGDIGVSLGDQVSPIRRGVYFSGWDFTTYGEHLEKFSKKTDGFEWFSTVRLREDRRGIDRRIEFAYPRFGRKLAESKLVWEFPGWALKYSWTGDADKAATAMYVTGGGEGEKKAWYARVNSDAITDGWPRLDETKAHDTVWDWQMLKSHGAKYLVAYMPPINSFTIQMHPRMPTDLSDYFIGDEVRLIIDDDLFKSAGIEETDMLARITGITVKPNDNGLEEVTPEMVIAIRDLKIVDPDDESSDLVPDNWPGPTIDAPDIIPAGGEDERPGLDEGTGDTSGAASRVLRRARDGLDGRAARSWQRGLHPDPGWDDVRRWGGSYE